MQELFPPASGVLDEHLSEAGGSTHFTVLFVCTANVCRSPMACAIAQHLLPQNARVLLHSAGVRADSAHSTDPLAIDVLAERGIRAEPQPAEPLTDRTVSDADLVLAAERGHRASVLATSPAALSRAFTLLEFARIIGALDSVQLRQARSAGPREVVRLASGSRGVARAPTPDADDIDDPVGRSLRAFRACAEAISAALETALPPLAPPAG